MDTFNIYIKNLLGAVVILNWIARTVWEKSRAVYRHSVACAIQPLRLFRVKLGLQKSLTDIWLLQENAQKHRSLPPGFSVRRLVSLQCYYKGYSLTSSKGEVVSEAGLHLHVRDTLCFSKNWSRILGGGGWGNTPPSPFCFETEFPQCSLLLCRWGWS